jgi:Flp pilus assembly protein TadG
MNSCISAIERLRGCRRGVTALEFGLIAPALVLCTFGLIELSLVLFDLHRLGHAARAAARTAAVEQSIASLATLKTTPVVCTSAGSVSCTGGALTSPATFTSILAAAQAVVPSVGAANMRVTYRESGAVSAGTALPIVTPAITVEFTRLEKESFFLKNALPGSLSTYTLPSFSSTMIGASIVQ